MSASRLRRILLTASFTAVVATLALNRAFYRESIGSLFMAVALASILLIHFSIRPLREIVPVALIAIALMASEYLVHGWKPHLWPTLGILGLSSSLAMAVQATWIPKPRERYLILCGLIPSLLLSFSDWTGSTSLLLIGEAHPKVLDLYLYKFDCSLGFLPSFLVGQFLLHRHWLFYLSIAFYLALPVPLALVYGQQLKAKGRAALPLFYAFLIAGPAGIVCYNILPALGPVHVFANFPAYPSSVEAMRSIVPSALRLPGGRNAIPSLHLAWVLLAWWGARGLRLWVRLVALAFVVFTILATMGTGEHYFVDLVVACPFALAIHAAFAQSAPGQVRKSAALAGICLTLAWMAALSFAGNLFWFSRLIPWAAVVGTVVGVWFMVRQLASKHELPSEASQSENELAAVAQ
jgi:hypothetical protein